MQENQEPTPLTEEEARKSLEEKIKELKSSPRKEDQERGERLRLREKLQKVISVDREEREGTRKKRTDLP